MLERSTVSRRLTRRTFLQLMSSITLSIAGLSHGTALGYGGRKNRIESGPTDRLQLGLSASERKHELRTRGDSRAIRGIAEAGTIVEDYLARSVERGGSFSAILTTAPRHRLSLQIREVRPNGSWGAQYGYQVFLNDVLCYERDPSIVDPGGGPYSSIFLDTSDLSIVTHDQVKVDIVSTSDEPAYFTDIWVYADLDDFVEREGMRTPCGIYPVVGKDYHSTQALQDNIGFVLSHLHTNQRVKLGIAILDYFPVRSAAQMASNYDRYIQLAQINNVPVAIEHTSDWEGTPKNIPDGKGGKFGDIRYQQILWSETDQSEDMWNGEELADYLGERYDIRYGLSVPNVWGDTPWLTWNNPDLNSYYSQKLQQSLELIRDRVYELQRTGEHKLILPFSTTLESTYWSKQDGQGVNDNKYTEYNGGVERRTILAEFNNDTLAAAQRDGVQLDPSDGLDESEKWWLYKNQATPQQMFADLLYYGLPRERIKATPQGMEFPLDMLRHNVFSEVYSRQQAPYWSHIYPSLTNGFLHHARPGSEYISLPNYTPHGYGHLVKSREFGRIANPNLEDSVSGDWRDKLFLLRKQYINGSRYNTLYNWKREDVATWVNAFVDDPLPWDVVVDPGDEAQELRASRVGQTFMANDLRVINRIDVRVMEIPKRTRLELALYDSPDRQTVIARRHIGANEVVPRGEWTPFHFAPIELEWGRYYYLELQCSGKDSDVGRFVISHNDVYDVGSLYLDGTEQIDSDLAFRIGLDMEYERDRSLVIQWRRDASDAIAHVSEQLTREDDYAAKILVSARAALDAGRYVQAYRLAIMADALRYPVLYQSNGSCDLHPFPIHITSHSDVNIDLQSYYPGRKGSMTLTFMSYENDTISFEVRGGLASKHRVLVDGYAWASDSNGYSLRFEVRTASRTQYEVQIIPT